MTVAQTPAATSVSGKAYAAMAAKAREVKLIESCAAVLGWDQETMMPEGGVELRSAQLSHLARLSHQAFTNKEGENMRFLQTQAVFMGENTAL